MLVLIAILSGLSIAAAQKQVCCEGIGCFRTDGDYSHLPSPTCPGSMDLKYGLYTRNNRLDAQMLTRTSAIPPNFSNSRRTIFLVHGYTCHFEKSWMQTARLALLDNGDYNVVVVGWGGGAQSIYYPKSASNTRTVGAETALMMNRLINEAGAQASNVWCIGFSLGAHLCGHAGKVSRIGRITGLDPAGPWFDGKGAAARLDPTDATFVDTIHTDGEGLVAYYGLMTPIGHADYYPNGGSYQPGCITSNLASKNTMVELTDGTVVYGDIFDISCSHGRATSYFIQSLKVPNCFQSRQTCASTNKLPSTCSDCNNGNVCATMGYPADFSSAKSGLFYLQTSSRSPYCLY